jgi:hypothetical protein
MNRVKKLHPRLTHGCFSTKRLLPGEKEADFEKLHREVITELEPHGVLEKDIVETIAWLIWRKNNMGVFMLAEQCRRMRVEAIDDACRRRGVDPDGPRPEVPLDPGEAEENAKRYEAVQAGEGEARKKIGPEKFEWIQSETATVHGLLTQVELEERLSASIGKHLKQLLMLRGVKSLHPSQKPTKLSISD